MRTTVRLWHVCIVLFVVPGLLALTATVNAQADSESKSPPQALTAVDATMPVDHLQVVLRPLTKDELDVELGRWLDLLSGGTEYDIDFNSQQEGKSASWITYAAITSRSYHSGMVNVLIIDGSVRSVADGIDVKTWRALGTRRGGEVVVEY